jgi:hypothetical protein
VRHSQRKRGAPDWPGLRNTAPALDPTYLEQPAQGTANAGALCALKFGRLKTLLTNLGQGVVKPRLVRKLGERLLGGLQAHAAVAQVLDAALGVSSQTEQPIYLHLVSDKAEELPWETLFDNQHGQAFLALHKEWPVGRIIGTATPGQVLQGVPDPSIRLLAVLAAADKVSATPQWNALKAAVDTAIKQWKADVKIRVLVCDAALKTAIDGLNDPDIEAVPLADKQTLFDAVADFLPHLIHFFCHGAKAADGTTRLELATPSDFKAGRTRGSIEVEVQEFKDEIAHVHDNLWLITLNCCLGASASKDTRSLARLLVADGVPAVLGMREAIKDRDAHEFCGPFYRGVFRAIRPCWTAGSSGVEVEWAHALRGGRRSLIEKNGGKKKSGAECKEWTLPVLYVRPEPFKLLPPPAAAAPGGTTPTAAASQLRTLTQVRAALAQTPGVPQDQLNRIDAEIGRLVAQLYPS